ncbi:MAG TPA: 7-carboxy-7-deazaguanine synthase QueE [Pirellulales bacterium]|nr:7-carboxy-7-deazaguanine synthase QueE [Pirellulales bacterium]
MKIAELYISIQGEGLLTGRESVFVRSSGCNLRCWYCDTPFTSWAPEGVDLSVPEIIERVERFDCEHVVLTGGEPMLHAELVPLSEELHRRGKHVTIETAGTLYLPVACKLMSISPKLAGSGPSEKLSSRWRRRHETTRHVPHVIRRLLIEYDYQLKFVVDSPADCDAVEQWLAEFPEADRERVLLMPQGTDADQLAERALWLQPYCHSAGLRFCPRRQIEWFGLLRGT